MSKKFKECKPKVNLERLKHPCQQELCDWLAGTPDDVIEQIRCIKDQYANWNDLVIDYEWSYSDCRYFVSGYILESDEDYESRIKQEKEELEVWEYQQAVLMEQIRIKEEEKKKAELAEKLKQYEELQADLKKQGVI